jgi:hypothetical protein
LLAGGYHGGGTQGSMSDYINTALATHNTTPPQHYDTDFPELTSKFENFGLNNNIEGQNLPDLF